MPSLIKILPSYDIDLLLRIARAWKYDEVTRNRNQVEAWLVKKALDDSQLKEIIESLPKKTLQAFLFIKDNNGRMPWSEFKVKFGEIRSLGPAARERFEPDLHPQSIAEELYYLGLIGKAFLDAAPEPREFAFIPDEFIGNLVSSVTTMESPAVRPVSQTEIKRWQPANTRLLDHVTDCLSSLRMKRSLPREYFTRAGISANFIQAISRAAGLTTKKDEIITEAIGKFLQSNRLTTMKEWFTIWAESIVLNDLRMIPGLEFEGIWQNDPLFARRFILQYIQKFDLQTWYSLQSLVNGIRSAAPDFQRPAGNFDTWSIRKAGSMEYLIGREHWDEIDGAYIRYLISGPLHWLGVVDIAYNKLEGDAEAFRLSPLAHYLLNENTPAPALAVETPPKLAPDLTIVFPVNSSLLMRYQAGRFASIRDNSSTETRYQVTAASLIAAEAQDLMIDQLIQLLEKYIKSPIPESYKKLAHRWGKNHLEAAFEKCDLLRVKDPELITILKEHPRVSKMIKEILTSNVVVMHAGGIEIARKVLQEAGVLSQSDLDV